MPHMLAYSKAHWSSRVSGPAGEGTRAFQSFGPFSTSEKKDEQSMKTEPRSAYVQQLYIRLSLRVSNSLKSRYWPMML